MNDISNSPTQYDSKQTEKNIYEFWESNGFFKANANSNKPSYSIVIPPPNVTGVLHMGHALDGTIQDILIRYKRMSGYETLWMPGTDHAGIATQNVVEKKLREENLSKYDLGREKFLDITWKWAKEHKSQILTQFKRLGASFDLSRERFTLDEGLSHAVKEVFIKLYEKGLIYKGSYVVNWCPRCQSAISDVETEYESQDSKLYEISYPFKNESGAIIVATTRPETIFGDVAICVNPNDYKYRDFIGKTVIMPLTGRELPIIADDYVDKTFGTGALKITPAHDVNDFEVGKRHSLKPIKVIDECGKLMENSYVPIQLQGLDRFVVREMTIKMLEEQKTLLRSIDYNHNVGKCQRCNTIIEPLLSNQWFVKMEPLAKKAIEVVEKGDIKFIPNRYSKNYLSWMNNIRDWCISRQLWWGHQIPAYYNRETGEMVVAYENPDPNLYFQDEDVLDTWFSSGLWPFSTMGWPNCDSNDYKKFYPTSVLVTGFDIIFFWVARMIVLGLEFTDKPPFSEIYIHGLIRDSLGQKMSKSKGNTVDPVEIIDKYGSDALRFTLTSLSTYGSQDIKVSDERFEYGRNFANKIWNASRFVLMNISNLKNKTEDIDLNNLTVADKWILNELNEVCELVNENFKNYRFGEAAHILYEFFWNSYCDWYVELSKVQLSCDKIKVNTQNVLKYVLDMSLRLLHPIMPHITEQIWQMMPGDKKYKAIMLADFPNYEEKFKFPICSSMLKEIGFESVKGIRNIRHSLNLPANCYIDIEIATNDREKEFFEEILPYLKKLTKINNVKFLNKGEQTLKKCSNCVIGNSLIVIPLENLIDIKDEIDRQNKKLEKIRNEKSSLEVKMNNKNFISKAKVEIIKQTEDRINELNIQEQSLISLITSLS